MIADAERHRAQAASYIQIAKLMTNERPLARCARSRCHRGIVAQRGPAMRVPAAGLGLPNPATLRDVNGNGHKYRAAEQNHPGNHDFTPNTLGNFDAFDAAAGSTRSGGLIP
jgi:hypothetical protein